MNKRILIILGGLVILLAGGYFLFFANNTNKQATTPQIQEENIPTISAEEIGLTLKPGSDGHRVVMQVAKTDDINSLDYELSYTAKGNIPRGVIGHVDVKTGEKVSREIYLGTCSDVCHPDSEVSNIKLIVKVNKSDGKVYQTQTTTSL